MPISKAKAKARAKKAAATRKRNAAAGKKGSSKKSSAKKSSAKKSVHHGKTVASPTYAGKKFKCAGKTVKAGRKGGRRKMVPRVFCRRAEKK